MIGRRHFLAGAAASVVAAPMLARAQQTTTVRMGSLKLIHSIAPSFYDRFTPAGVKVEVIPFESPTECKNAVVTKSVDFGTFGIAAAILGGAVGEPVVVVGAMSNKGMGVIAKAGSDTRTIKDLKGKKVGIWPGSTQEVFIFERLKMEGMSVKDEKGVIRVLKVGDEGAKEWDPLFREHVKQASFSKSDRGEKFKKKKKGG